MTLRAYIKSHKLTSKDYIALYNKDNRRFDGSFSDSKYLEPYLDMDIGNVELMRFIHKITIPSYSDMLGINLTSWLNSKPSQLKLPMLWELN